MNQIKTDEFDYELPDERIAKFPLQQRDSSKLLIYDKGKISQQSFVDLPDLLHPDSLLVFNNTKVVHARIIFYKNTGAQIEIFCLEPAAPNNYEQNFATTTECIWHCTVGNLKKWKNKTLRKKFIYDSIEDELTVDKIENNDESLQLKFRWNSGLSFAQVMDVCGKIPVPPYLKRESQDIDSERYQTIYCKPEGSVAAPTAGLHFSNDVLQRLKLKNIETDEITLHVGAGTFKPLKTEFVDEHVMHNEHFFVKKTSIQKIIKYIGNITAVGTTSVRTLESLYWLGCKIKQNQNIQNLNVQQFEPYQNNFQISVEESLQAILDYLDNKNLYEISASTQIMILPDYKPKTVNKLITNFHQPKSTLLLLIAAFTGNDWRKVYDYALKNDFRFLSYGDSSVLIPASIENS
ncbi:MAG: S-adenosylmethionine:tRNA ribosyltransferase-isomerase [Prevotellaceae bacterium]|jgi:S-adenosylmethionine:tRNA ribosyltransferase-isomerase|nr:S-adenosylmethionine:tRNA ribosyltransferase-isomerase [Prevotellaceae bacterium]